ncbi:MAG: hypothetical protein ACXAC2_15130 [Candidatus Kariarchaeaceae archaeon]|jgi:hypothetical protein
MPLLSLESVIRVIALIFYSGIAYYFFMKYRRDKIVISLYWMGTFISWALGSLIALYMYLVTDDNFIASDYFGPFIAFGVGIIASSTIELELVDINKRVWYLIVGTITIVASLFAFDLIPILYWINKLALVSLILLVPVPYVYLAYQGRDLRLSLVTLALFFHMPVSLILLELFPDPTIHQIIILILDIILALGLLAFKKE